MVSNIIFDTEIQDNGGASGTIEKTAAQICATVLYAETSLIMQ